MYRCVCIRIYVCMYAGVYIYIYIYIHWLRPTPPPCLQFLGGGVVVWSAGV